MSKVKSLLLVAALSAASTAEAAPLIFTVSGDYSARFVYDSNPMPTIFEDGVGFIIESVPGQYEGFTLADITFFNASADFGGEIDIAPAGTFDYALTAAFGPQAYTGPESAPTFLIGAYDYVGLLDQAQRFTLTIAAIPEPATWAMMMLGFGMVGYGLRHGKRAVTTRVAFA